MENLVGALEDVEGLRSYLSHLRRSEVRKWREKYEREGKEGREA